MCGLVGFLGGVATAEGRSALLRRMAGTLVHRGPDDAGTWTDADNRIGFGHRRLAIVDLSAAGHQPMGSASGRFVMVFNGEIYNHLELRSKLEVLGQAPAWLGHSDTETLLAGIEAWGLEATLKMMVGMFAIALWDCKTRTLSLARDRMGEKPLYYGWQSEGATRAFLFGSELKSLKAHPSFSASIDRGALCLFMRYNYIPAPYSIYQGIAKLEPGCLLTVSLAQPEPQILKYWDIAQVAQAGVAQPFLGTASEAVDGLEVLVKAAVRQQMLADVPLGAFLSGGVDSSTVVALMQTQSARPVKTFTIGFEDDAYSEAVHAKKVAQYLGTEHIELYVTPQQVMDVIPRLPDLYCEPFADSSQIPTFLVSQLASRHVKVSLSGDGGDELFCGYNRYEFTARHWQSIARIPAPLRSIVGRGIVAISPHTWNRYIGRLPWTSVGDKLHKGAAVMASASASELYLGLVSSWDDPSALVIGGAEPPTRITDNLAALTSLSDVERMMALDTLSYLPDDILVKVDRAAMGASLENRVPLLDHRLVEFAWRLPMGLKLCRGETKWVLRQVLNRHVPRELIERPKMGFGLPLDIWLRGPLKAWAEELLDEQRLVNEGFFHAVQIRQKWVEHLLGIRNWCSHLWAVLMFQAWLEKEAKQ
jgi:asparagine synthase (glutamine-hydrolysing)